MARSNRGERSMDISKIVENIPTAVFCTFVAVVLTISPNLAASENTDIIFVSSMPEYMSPEMYDSDFQFDDLSLNSFERTIVDSIDTPNSWTLAKTVNEMSKENK